MGTKLWPQHQSSKLRGREDACLDILDKNWREKVLNVLLLIYFIFQSYQSVYTRTVQQKLRYISLLSVDSALLPGCTNWPSSCFSIMSPGGLCFFPQFLCMHTNPSVQIQWLNGGLLFLCPWNSAPVLLFLFYTIVRWRFTVQYITIEIRLLKPNPNPNPNPQIC